MVAAGDSDELLLTSWFAKVLRYYCLGFGRGQAALEEAVSDLGDAASWVVADIASPTGASRVADAAQAQLGQINGVLVNAGGPPPGAALDVADDVWEEAFQLLIAGPMRLIRSLVPRMADGGSILFVNGSAYIQPLDGVDTSNVLRPAVAALVRTLSGQLAPRIRVNSLAPGRIDTERIRALDAERAAQMEISAEELTALAAAEVPLRRYGKPAEFGSVAAFLLSPTAPSINGLTLLVDGGLVSTLQ